MPRCGAREAPRPIRHGAAGSRHDALARIPPGVYEAEEVIDGDGITEDPIPVRVRVEITPEQFVADFTEVRGPREQDVMAGDQ